MAKGRLLAVDVAIATFLLLWAVAEVYGSGAENQVGPRWATFAAYAVAAVAVAWRRWRPLPVLLALSLVLSVPVLVWGASETLASLLPVLVGMYTVAAQAPRQQILLGGAVAGASAILSVARDPLMEGPADIAGAAPFLVLVAVAWAMGEYTRTRRLYVAGLAAQVDAAERERGFTARLAVLDERQRIAQELHDVIAHGLTVMIRQVEAGLVRLDTDQPLARTHLEAVAATGRESLGEVRLLVSLLDGRGEGPEGVGWPPQHRFDDAETGLSSLSALARRMSVAGLDVTVVDQRGPRPVPLEVDLAAYRVVQEALTNVLRHADATTATVHVHRSVDRLTVEVEDDGRGPADDTSHGHGLHGMRERVGIFGGTVDLHPTTPHGCRVSAEIPLPAHAPAPAVP